MSYDKENNAIKTEEDYENALREIERLFFLEFDAAEYEKMETLIGLVEKYEEAHYSIPAPSFFGKIAYYLQNRRSISRWIQ
ncbi:MAG: transcriptional regulator [Spirochaetota bacterium]